MKKLLAILLCLVMVLSVALFTGCSEEKKADEEKPASSATESKDNNAVADKEDEKEDNKEDENQGGSTDAATLGTCDTCEDENVALTPISMEGFQFNVCADCYEIFYVDMTSVVDYWYSDQNGGVEIKVEDDGTALLTIYGDNPEDYECTWTLEDDVFTLVNKETNESSTGIFSNGDTLDFSADGGPVFTR
ncbi:MAG: hypothetical protein IKT68_08495 [Clostridia bacterium]|nr:hypothetical protein [Clostridia bacterium]